MTKIDTGKYGPQRYEHFGYVVEQVGIVYRIWFDFVTAEYLQPIAKTLAAARAAIAFELAKELTL